MAENPDEDYLYVNMPQKEAEKIAWDILWSDLLIPFILFLIAILAVWSLVSSAADLIHLMEVGLF
jgi:hypothetical protein